MPKGIVARPTTDMARENIMNIIENLVDLDGKDCLDLFAGTGAISWELISRGAASVTSVEIAAPQCRFIEKVAQELGEKSLHLVRGDALKFIEGSGRSFDLVFADPPYNMPGFAEIASKVMNSNLLKPGAYFILEHNKEHDFSELPGFVRHRNYGSVNFSIFQQAE